MMSRPAPQATAPRPRLHLVAPTQQQPIRPLQDCQRCRLMPHCWAQQTSAKARVVNLLVCRLEKATKPRERDRVTRVLLRMLRPKFLKIASRMSRTLRNSRPVHIEDLVIEMESVAIQSLLTQYRMGEALHPLHWLFGRPNGAVTRWAFKRVTTAQRESYLTSSYGLVQGRTGEDLDLTQRLLRKNYSASQGRIRQTLPAQLIQPAFEYDTDTAIRERTSRVLHTLQDGVTLSVVEFRAVSFCLHNASVTGAPLSGLHQALGQRAGTPRKAISRAYGQGVRRLLDATGESSRYFRQLGLSIPSTARPRRAALRRRTSHSHSLSVDEIIDLLHLKNEQRVTVQDLAWMYGISEDFLYRLSRRFRGLSPAEIRAICKR